jgi:Methyltransferase domain
MEQFSPEALCVACKTYSNEIANLMRGAASPGFFDPNNSYYRTPDAEILYSMVRLLTPRLVVEVGSGNSSRIIHQAITDGKLQVEHIAIDPSPRSDISGLVSRILPARFEDVESDSIIRELGPNDILFIDSSHEVRVGNDVAKLYCVTIPQLVPGVAVHVHDIFLPFDYPQPFCVDYPHWGEQYLLQVMLQFRKNEVLWPGYYVQTLRPDLHKRFPFLKYGRAQSFWFRT